MTDPFPIMTKSGIDYVAFAADRMITMTLGDFLDTQTYGQIASSVEKLDTERPPKGFNFTTKDTIDIDASCGNMEGQVEKAAERYGLFSMFSFNYWKWGLIVVGVGLTAKLIFIGGGSAPIEVINHIPAPTVLAPSPLHISAPPISFIPTSSISDVAASINSSANSFTLSIEALINLFREAGNFTERVATCLAGYRLLTLLIKILSRGRC
jgi:hypothetical protein